MKKREEVFDYCNMLNRARKEGHYALTSWAWEDIQLLKEDWSEQECKDWLEENEETLKDCLIEHGWDILRDSLL